MKRKGQFDVLTDYFEFFIGLFIFTLALLIMGVILYNFGIASNETGLYSGKISVIIDFMLNYPTYFDWLGLLAYILSLITSIIIARVLPANIGLTILSAFMFFIYALGLMILSNIMYVFIQNAVFDSIRSQIFILPFMWSHAILFAFVYFVITAWALFGGKEIT